MLSQFGFDVPSTREKHSCCDICVTDCQCSESVDLCLDVSSIHVQYTRTDSDRLGYGHGRTRPVSLCVGSTERKSDRERLRKIH